MPRSLVTGAHVLTIVDGFYLLIYHPNRGEDFGSSMVARIGRMEVTIIFSFAK